MPMHTENLRPPSKQEQSDNNHFYGTFISVMFGFAASVAVQWMVEAYTATSIDLRTFLMFAGVIIQILHFWMICTSTDDLEDTVWNIAFGRSGRRHSVITVLNVYTLLMTTAFICPLIVMAKSLFTWDVKLWKAFLVLSVFSLVYDFVALGVGTIAGLNSTDSPLGKKTVFAYTKLFLWWTVQNAVLALIAGILYTVYGRCSNHPTALAAVFFLVSGTDFVVDTTIIHPKTFSSAIGAEQ